MNHGLTRTTLIGSLALLLMVLPVSAFQQTKAFILVEGATLKAKIDNAIAAGRANAVNGRFWVAYQFEVWKTRKTSSCARARSRTSAALQARRVSLL